MDRLLNLEIIINKLKLPEVQRKYNDLIRATNDICQTNQFQILLPPFIRLSLYENILLAQNKDSYYKS